MTGSLPRGSLACRPLAVLLWWVARLGPQQASLHSGPRGRAGLMETAPSPTFATLLRRYRQAAGLSQEELAARAGLSARTVGDLERGGSHAPRKDTVELLAQALDLGAPERAALAEAARRLSTAAATRPGP